MSKEQDLDKGIRQKSTKRVNLFIVCSAFCPWPPNHDPMDSEKQLRVYTSRRTMACHVWRVDKAPGHTHRNWNACLKVLRLSMGKICACTYDIRCELIKVDCQNLRVVSTCTGQNESTGKSIVFVEGGQNYSKKNSQKCPCVDRANSQNR